MAMIITSLDQFNEAVRISSKLQYVCSLIYGQIATNEIAVFFYFGQEAVRETLIADYEMLHHVHGDTTAFYTVDVNDPELEDAEVSLPSTSC